MLSLAMRGGALALVICAVMLAMAHRPGGAVASLASYVSLLPDAEAQRAQVPVEGEGRLDVWPVAPEATPELAVQATRNLLGSEATTYASEATAAPGKINAFQFVATATGVVKELTIRSGSTPNTAKSLVLGIAGEDHGVPAHAPLGQGTVTGTPGTDARSTVAGLSIPVVAGVPYWLEVLDVGGSYHYRYAGEANSRKGAGLSWIESQAGGLASLTNSQWGTSEAGVSAPMGPMCFYARGTGTTGTQKTRFGIAGNQDNGHSATWIAGKVYGGSHGSLAIEYNQSPSPLLAAVGKAITLGIDPPLITINTPDGTPLEKIPPATYAEDAVAIMKRIVAKYPKVKIFELINEPWFKGHNGSTAPVYAALVQATYQKAAAAGLGGLTLLVGAYGDYQEQNAKGELYVPARWSQTYHGRGWVADMLTSHPALLTLINGWYSHPYGGTRENWQQNAGMYATQSQRLMVISHGGSGYENWWITEVGFALGGEGVAGVKNQREQSEKLGEDLETAVEWSQQGWLTGLLVYDDSGTRVGGDNVWPSHAAYTTFASRFGWVPGEG